MSFLWDKPGVAADAAVMEFLAGDDVVQDRALLPYDADATAAHARGLARIGLLTHDDAAAIGRELAALKADFARGDFVLDARYEDGHTAIEARLTERLGDLGRRVHAGRSRNDQVQTALRLYMKDALVHLRGASARAGDACLSRAREGEALPMPGYTHLQRAVPSSVGLWMAAFAEAFADDADAARAAHELVDASPLGAAAGYGVNLPLDRAGVARDLGFARIQVNPMAAQNSRGKLELLALAPLEQAMLDVRRLSWDLSLFATAEVGFVELDRAFVTGSSLMPNKRNPDAVELLRAQWAVVAGARAEIAGVLSLPSGYHRDLQATKGPFLRAFGASLRALDLVPRVVATMRLDARRMRAAISDECFATDAAVDLAARGVPFRDAYADVAARVSRGEITGDPAESLRARVSPGACADLCLDAIAARLAAHTA